jgi:hypothetical protein
MQLATPIIHLEVDGTSTYHIHVITWFDNTKFKANGHDTLPGSATSGVFPITLFVSEDSGVPEMELLTPVVHTVTLTGITLNGTNPFIEVTIYNTSGSSQVSKKKMHKESAGNSAMPDPGSR